MSDLCHYFSLRELGLTRSDKFLQSRKLVRAMLEYEAAKPVKNQPCEFSGEPRATFLMDFSPNMLKVASTHGDHTVRVTDIPTGKCTHILTGHPRTPWCLAFHPTSNDILASGCLGGEVRIWDLLGGGQELLHNPKTSNVITSLAFHPTDQLLVFATLNYIYFWDWSKPAPFAYTKTSHEYERLRWLRFDPFGHYLFTGIANNTTVRGERSTSNVVHISDDGHPDESDGMSSRENSEALRASNQRRNSLRYQQLLERFATFHEDQAVASGYRRLIRHTNPENAARASAREEWLDLSQQGADASASRETEQGRHQREITLGRDPDRAGGNSGIQRDSRESMGSEPPPRGGPSSERPVRSGSSNEPPSRSGPSSELPPRNGPSSELPPRSGPSSELPPRSGPSSELPPRSGPSSEQPPRSGPSSEQPPRSGPSSEQPPRSGPSSELPPRSGPSSELLPRSGPSGEQPPRSGPSSELPPRSGPSGEPPPRSGPSSLSTIGRMTTARSCASQLLSWYGNPLTNSPSPVSGLSPISHKPRVSLRSLVDETRTALSSRPGSSSISRDPHQSQHPGMQRYMEARSRRERRWGRFQPSFFSTDDINNNSSRENNNSDSNNNIEWNSSMFRNSNSAAPRQPQLSRSLNFGSSSLEASVGAASSTSSSPTLTSLPQTDGDQGLETNEFEILPVDQGGADAVLSPGPRIAEEHVSHHQERFRDFLRNYSSRLNAASAAGDGAVPAAPGSSSCAASVGRGEQSSSLAGAGLGSTSQQNLRESSHNNPSSSRGVPSARLESPASSVTSVHSVASTSRQDSSSQSFQRRRMDRSSDGSSGSAGQFLGSSVNQGHAANPRSSDFNNWSDWLRRLQDQVRTVGRRPFMVHYQPGFSFSMDNRASLTDQTSQTFGVMSLPASLDQGTDVTGLEDYQSVPEGDSVTDQPPHEFTQTIFSERLPESSGCEVSLGSTVTNISTNVATGNSTDSKISSVPSSVNSSSLGSQSQFEQGERQTEGTIVSSNSIISSTFLPDSGTGVLEHIASDQCPMSQSLTAADLAPAVSRQNQLSRAEGSAFAPVLPSQGPSAVTTSVSFCLLTVSPPLPTPLPNTSDSGENRTTSPTFSQITQDLGLDVLMSSDPSMPSGSSSLRGSTLSGVGSNRSTPARLSRFSHISAASTPASMGSVSYCLNSSMASHLSPLLGPPIASTSSLTTSSTLTTNPTSTEGQMDVVRDVQERLQQAVQQLRDVQSSVRELTSTTPNVTLTGTDAVTEYLERRVSELDRRISDLEESYSTRLRELHKDYYMMRRTQSIRDRRRYLASSPYYRRNTSRLLSGRVSTGSGRLSYSQGLNSGLELQSAEHRARMSLGEGTSRAGFSESTSSQQPLVLEATGSGTSAQQLGNDPCDNGSHVNAASSTCLDSGNKAASVHETASHRTEQFREAPTARPPQECASSSKQGLEAAGGGGVEETWIDRSSQQARFSESLEPVGLDADRRASGNIGHACFGPQTGDIRGSGPSNIRQAMRSREQFPRSGLASTGNRPYPQPAKDASSRNLRETLLANRRSGRGTGGAGSQRRVLEYLLSRNDVPSTSTSRSRPVPTTSMGLPASVTIHPAPEEEEGSGRGADSSVHRPLRYRPRWHSLQQRHLHSDYSGNILDDTINRRLPLEQRILTNSITGAYVGREDSAISINVAPHTHRIQRWKIYKRAVPDIANAQANIVVEHCKLHNDASCDLSKDGTLLAAFVTSNFGFPDNNILALFSLRKKSFAQCVFTKRFGPNAISVSISPENHFVMVGLAAQRLFFFTPANQMIAQVYKLVKEKAGEKSMNHVTDVYHPIPIDIRNHVSVNSGRWLPGIGEGMVYGTNRGDLHFCRPGARQVLEKEPSGSRRSRMGRIPVRLQRLSAARRNSVTRSTIATQTTTVSIRRTASTQTTANNGEEEDQREEESWHQ